MQILAENQSAQTNFQSADIQRTSSAVLIQIVWASVSAAAGVFLVEASLDKEVWTTLSQTAITNGTNNSDACLFDITLRMDVNVRVRYVANSTSTGTFTIKAKG